MLEDVPLHKLHTGEVLPMPHRLFEQSLVLPSKVGINLIRDHAVVPDPLFPRCSRTDLPPSGELWQTDIGDDYLAIV